MGQPPELPAPGHRVRYLKKLLALLIFKLRSEIPGSTLKPEGGNWVTSEQLSRRPESGRYRLLFG